MKDSSSDPAFSFRRSCSRYSFKTGSEKNTSGNVQLKRASWSSFPLLKLAVSEEGHPQNMQSKTSSKSRSSENLKKPHKLLKSKSTSFFKTTSNIKNLILGAFSSSSSSSAASVVSSASSESSCSSSSTSSSPKIRSSWSSGVAHILEKERCSNTSEECFDSIDITTSFNPISSFVPPSSSSSQSSSPSCFLPPYNQLYRTYSNGYILRNGHFQVAASLLEEDEEEDLLMNTPKIICAHRKTPDVERKTRTQIVHELQHIKESGKLPANEKLTSTTPKVEKVFSYYESLPTLQHLRGYNPPNHRETVRKETTPAAEELNDSHLAKLATPLADLSTSLSPEEVFKKNLLNKITTEDNLRDNKKVPRILIEEMKKQNVVNDSKGEKDDNALRMSISASQDDSGDKNVVKSNGHIFTFNPLAQSHVTFKGEIDYKSDCCSAQFNDTNVMFNMLNYSGENDFTDEDSDCESADDTLTIRDDDSSCFEKRLEDNLETLEGNRYSQSMFSSCDLSLTGNSRNEIQNHSRVGLSKDICPAKPHRGSSCEAQLAKKLLTSKNLDKNLCCENFANEKFSSDKFPDKNISNEEFFYENISSHENYLTKTSEKPGSVSETRTNGTASGNRAETTMVNNGDVSVTNKKNGVLKTDNVDGNASDFQSEERVTLRKKPWPNLHLDTGKSQVNRVLFNERLIRRLTEEEIDVGAKSPRSPRTPAIDIDNIFKERQKQLDDCSKDNLTKVKDLTQRLRLPLQPPPYLLWLKGIPDKEAAHQLAEVFSPVILVDNQGEFQLQDKSRPPTEDERNKNLTRALQWIKEELVKMKEQDQQLASQLVSLQLEMQRLRLVRSCTQHEALLEEVVCEEEEQRAFMTSADLYDPLNSHRDSALSGLRDIGVTRMNITHRRFTLR